MHSASDKIQINKTSQNQRDDIVISIGLLDVGSLSSKALAIQVALLVEKISLSYKYLEVLIPLEEEQTSSAGKLLSIPGVRLFQFSQKSNVYVHRHVIANEAIGDVLVLSSFEEINCCDIQRMIQKVENLGRCLITEPNNSKFFKLNLLNRPLSWIGSVSGHRITSIKYNTLIIPRSIIHGFLYHRDPSLALRFPPKNQIVGDIISESIALPKDYHAKPRFWSRVKLLHKLLIELAPRLLILVSILSAFMCLLGGCFATYVLYQWIFVSNLEPGWVSTSMVLSLILFIFGLVLFGFSLALQFVIASAVGVNDPPNFKELTGPDIFSVIENDLNVELTSELGR